jgi:hypothetical protein
MGSSVTRERQQKQLDELKRERPEETEEGISTGEDSKE